MMDFEIDIDGIKIELYETTSHLKMMMINMIHGVN